MKAKGISDYKGSIIDNYGGGGEIRTHERLPVDGFQDRYKNDQYQLYISFSWNNYLKIIQKYQSFR
ncbi:hypothetical protein BJP43_09820 [Candidatus Williamhamiltonella defendens]|uniref:Uncharacterized protein n=1 Tax=Candidatus Williamhamiltonella defendens TaxID=138072 RepID=A0A2D3TFD3_9ENTR|nr:hypothetical protein BJP43_09820 [Candidatus Hamiltonella defensa]